MRLRRFVACVLLLLVLVAHSLPVSAQSSPPSPIPVDDPAIERDEAGREYVRASAPDEGGNSVQSLDASAPDQFGYTWSNVGMTWVDATSGVDTGMSGDTENQAVGPIALPFPFTFYQNTYSSLYIAGAGYLSFTPYAEWDEQFRLKNPFIPNNIVAPYAAPFALGGSGKNGHVFYTSGGVAPARYFVVEWHNVRGPAGSNLNDLYRFQVILSENGDVTFNYQAMQTSRGYYCGTSGIENAEGIDGLVVMPICTKPPSSGSVRFTRPGGQGRLLVFPLAQGRFTQAATSEVFDVIIQNTSDLGPDRYDVTGQPAGRAVFSFTNGAPLSDTDGNGTVDTGLIAFNESRTVRATIETPQLLNPLTSFSATVLLTSGRTPSAKRTVKLGLAAPAPVAQIATINDSSGLRILMAQPTNVANSVLPGDPFSSSSALVAVPGKGYVAAWQDTSSRDSLSYVILDGDGTVTSSIRRLGMPATPGASTSAGYPALAVNAGGNIAIAWQELRYRQTNSVRTFSTNIVLAILDSNGNVVQAPQRITANDKFGTFDDVGVPRFEDPTVARVAGTRFLVAWEREEDVTVDSWTVNIDLTVREGTGAVVVPVSRYSSTSAQDKDYALDPYVTPLANGEVLLIYTDSDIHYVRLADHGDVVAPKQTIPQGDLYADMPTAVQMAGGNVLVAWNVFWNQVDVLQFGVIDGGSFGVIAGPGRLAVSEDVGAVYPSITADALGNGIVTWMSAVNDYIAGAVISSNGSIVMAPQVFMAPAAADYLAGRVMMLRYPVGYSNAPLPVQPSTTTQSDPILTTSSTAGGPQNGQAVLQFDVQNRGLQSATGLTLQAQLDPTLTFLSAEPPPVALGASADGGGTVTWFLGDLAYLGGGTVQIVTTVPSTTVGATWPVTITLTSSTSVLDPTHGEAQTQVMEMEGYYLPRAAR